ncbi:MAG TPA: hypothetical protein VM864_06750 [Pyrinomonadaceae bacterium]|jgi:hypothetical protein|nr:hypothetical protein [Pyrinomonadaceae bacterium]
MKRMKRLLVVAVVCAASVCHAAAQKKTAATPPEKAALEFVAAMLYDREPARALGFFDRGAERKGAGRGSAVADARRELPELSKQGFAVSEIVFFRRGDIDGLRARFAHENYSGFNWDRVAARIDDGMGCLLVGKGPREDVLIAFVFREVGGRQKIVYQEDN